MSFIACHFGFKSHCRQNKKKCLFYRHFFIFYIYIC